jgi:hypothetical protein
MLISKSSYDAGDILTFKLVNGDEIVAKLVEQTDSAYTLDRPCTVVPSAKGIGLMQSLFTGEVDQKVVLDRNHVMMHVATVKDIKNHYLQTTTGISLVI